MPVWSRTGAERRSSSPRQQPSSLALGSDPAWAQPPVARPQPPPKPTTATPGTTATTPGTDDARDDGAGTGAAGRNGRTRRATGDADGAPATPTPAPAAEPAAPAPAAQRRRAPLHDASSRRRRHSWVSPVLPNAQFLGSYDAGGAGQRFYLFGTVQRFAEVVSYYRTVLKQKGELVFEMPATHMFEVGKFREDEVAFPPGVTVKDYTTGRLAGTGRTRSLGATPDGVPDDHPDRPARRRRRRPGR